MTDRKPVSKKGFKIFEKERKSVYRSTVIKGTFEGEFDADSWEVELGAVFGGKVTIDGNSFEAEVYGG